MARAFNSATLCDDCEYVVQNGEIAECTEDQTSCQDSTVLPGIERRVPGLRKYKFCGTCPRNYDVVAGECVRTRRCTNASFVYDGASKTCRFARFHRRSGLGYDVEDATCQVYGLPEEKSDKDPEYYICDAKK